MISRLISRFGGGCLQRCCAGRGRVVAQDAAEQAGQLRELGQDLCRHLVLVTHRGLRLPEAKEGTFYLELATKISALI